MSVNVTYSEIEAFRDDVAWLAANLEEESTILDEAAEAVGTPFGESDLKTAIEYFHDDWNTAREELTSSLESANEHAVAVADGWRNLDEDAHPQIPKSANPSAE